MITEYADDEDVATGKEILIIENSEDDVIDKSVFNKTLPNTALLSEENVTEVKERRRTES